MADKKISALTSATTPLAGTEVLPIVQSGATVKVSIANVTAGRAVSMLSGTITDSIATPVPLTINNNNPSVAAGTRVNFQFNGSTTGFVGNQFDGGDFNNLYNASKNHIFTRGATQTMLIDNANDITVSAGNLKIGTAAKGITTGSAISLGLGTNNSVTAVTIDTSGNLGVGAAPNATSGRNVTVNSVESSIALVTSGQRSFTIASGGNFQYTPGILSFIDNTAAATRMVIDAVGNVGIGTTTPAATALLDVQSTTKGVRFPNMTTTQKTAITPSAGTVIFDTTLSKLCVYSGAAWQTITSV